jgi:tRNA wybutosine-synthesizing protein 1
LQVLLFGNQMLEHLDSYELASEHAHSCCILLAHKKFKIGGQWHTHIDFDKFLVLAKSGHAFSSMDYLAPTPEWAVYGRGIAGDGGFDPSEFHYRRGAAAKARGGGC